MRKAFTLIELLVVLAIIAILFACFVPEGIGLLLIGWFRYPFRLAQERDVDWSSVWICLVSLGGLLVGTHYFGRWFVARRPTPTVWPWSRTLTIVAIGLLMFVAGIAAIGVTHETYWLATNPIRMKSLSIRTQSRNNLNQLGLAAHGFHDTNKHLPAGGTFDATGRGLHGWQAHLLPYLDQGPLFNQIDLKLPWNDPKNARVFHTNVATFLHPHYGDPPREGFAVSHYAGNSHVLGGKSLAMRDITDGASATIMMGEVAHDFKPWGMPMNCRDPAIGIDMPLGFGSPQGKIALFVLSDGTVHTIRADVSPAVLRALATPRSGDKVDLDLLDR